ncbi:MAG TPA: sigma factor-like helix-turn-helix DNA-binding protein [Actinophytocola sp.]|nr:sigma factor-like helix-turn-helix DNA-binding protein [Actinophytocola sp.]
MVAAVDEPAERLARLAFLLTGDQAHADRLLVARPDLDRDALVRDWLADPGHGYPPDPGPRTGAALDRELLRRALGELLPRQRAAVVLRNWAGLSLAETAAVLADPEPAVELATTAAFDLLDRPDPARLAAGLESLAVRARPAYADLVAAVRAGRRHRLRAVGVALAVLVLAGVLATVLGGGDPAGAPRAASDQPLPPPAMSSAAGPVPAPVVIDERSTRLTDQLTAARPTVLPGVTALRPAPAGRRTAYLDLAPLQFFTGATFDQGTYFAHAVVGAGPDAAILELEVLFRDPREDPRYTPCPEFEQDCTFRMLADGTWADVNVYTDPRTRRIIHSLTALRADGTYFHVTVYNEALTTEPPPLSVDELFRFATVFRY